MVTINIKDIFSKAESFVDNQLKDPTSVISKVKNDVLNFDATEFENIHEKKIINHIKKDFKKFLLQTPKEQQDFINSWIIKKPNLFYDYTIPGNDKSTLFGKSMKKTFRYTEFRAENCIDFSKIINIRTCPYCNAMLAINVGKKARYQIDHFFPKSRYPYLSISLFNLIPSCNNCNHIKGDKDVTLDSNFHLYSDKPSEEYFKFKMNSIDIIRNQTGLTRDQIQVDFTNTDVCSKSFAENHNKIFHIQDIYDTQNDIALELLWKSQVYHHLNIENLRILLKIDYTEVKRMIVGNYIDYHDIHKRPLAKYMQDIAKDLNMI